MTGASSIPSRPSTRPLLLTRRRPLLPRRAHRDLPGPRAGALRGGVHGADTTGWHGCGVRTPWAADVADATCGLDMLMQVPNGGMLCAEVSVMTPAACGAETFCPEAENVDGVAPNEHCSAAPVQTSLPMQYLPRRNYLLRRELACADFRRLRCRQARPL